MAETITQINQPAPFIEAAAKPFLNQLTQAVGGLQTQNLADQFGPQFVAGPSTLQTQAQNLASGLGGFEPFLQTAAASTGPQAYQQFMSPFQQDVISTTLQEFDRQAQKGLGSISDAAIRRGAFGGARQGVAESEFMTQSDKNRAALQAQLLQQGFGQAQTAAQQNFANQMNLASQVPALQGQQVAGLTTLGGALQGQRQAELSAQQQLKQQQLMQPLTAAQTYGQGIMGLISGYPTTTTTTQPTPSALQSALGAGATLAGVYRALR